jgi:hypothetical protein
MRLLRVPSGWPAAAQWSLIQFEPLPGYVASVAVPVPGAEASVSWLRPEEGGAESELGVRS